MDGILPIWKEKGMTSHDCVFKARQILGTKKVGHSGTLDPDVDGVLPIGVGKGTKLLEYLVDSSKTYVGELTIGYATSTEDASGEVTDQVALKPGDLSVEMIDRALKKFTGSIQQVPPMYSAVRVKGRRLYEYARDNEAVERPVRQVTIHDLNRTSDLTYHQDQETFSFRFKVTCSKGTYIRTLAVDLAKHLGYPGCLSQLSRLESGGFTIDQAISLSQLEEEKASGNLEDCLKPIETALSKLPAYQLSNEEWQKVKHGALLSKDQYGSDFPLALYYQDLVVAIYDLHPSKDHLLKPKKVLRTEM